MSLLRSVNPRKNEIVRVKFKSLNDIIKDSGMSMHDTEESYSLGANYKAILSSGDFLVLQELTNEREENDIPSYYLKVYNHYDYCSDFYIYDFMIESIEIIDHSSMFISNEHHVCIVRLGDELFINGKPLLGNEALRREEFKLSKRKDDKEEYENKNRKLLKLFEDFIADLAVRDSFKGE